MNYLLLLTHTPGIGPQEGTPEYDAEMERWGELTEEMRQAGVWVAVWGLRPTDTATTLRTQDGRPVMTDGPFTETKEVVFSLCVIDVPDLDAAAKWAEKMPNLAYGAVEIRPLVGDGS
jgi:hypothetical protein